MVKAAGELAPDAKAILDGENVSGGASLLESSDDVEEEKRVTGQEDNPEAIHSIEIYVPDIRDRRWYLSETDLGTFSCLKLMKLHFLLFPVAINPH